MNIRRFGTFDPVLDSSAYIDSQCSIIGQVTLGPHSSVWPMAVIRGDVNYIRIGSETNIQDGAILHVTHAGPFTSPTGSPLIIGNQVTVGHGAILHACTIGDRCLIGMNATILDATVVEAETIIAAGSLVPPRKHLEGGYLWAGNPARKVRPLSSREREHLVYSAQHYVKLADSFKDA